LAAGCASKKAATPQAVQKQPVAVDCGSFAMGNFADEQKARGCFNQYFLNCSPAKMSVSIDAGQSQSVFSFEIKNRDESSCKIESIFLKDPHPNWVGKTMECLFNPNEDFQKQMQAPQGKCSGELFDILFPTKDSPPIPIEPSQSGAEKTDTCGLVMSLGAYRVNSGQEEALFSSRTMSVGMSELVHVAGLKGSSDQIKWKSSDVSVVTVEKAEDGEWVRAKKAGKAKINATDTSVSPSCSAVTEWEVEKTK
jgi:hypothetical protein